MLIMTSNLWLKRYFPCWCSIIVRLRHLHLLLDFTVLSDCMTTCIIDVLSMYTDANICLNEVIKYQRYSVHVHGSRFSIVLACRVGRHYLWWVHIKQSRDHKTSHNNLTSQRHKHRHKTSVENINMPLFCSLMSHISARDGSCCPAIFDAVYTTLSSCFPELGVAMPQSYYLIPAWFIGIILYGKLSQLSQIFYLFIY